MPIKPKKLEGFNGIWTHAFCLSAAVLYQLSYGNPYIWSQPICWLHLNLSNRWNRLKRIISTFFIDCKGPIYTYSIYFNENSRWKATFQKRSLEWKYRGVRIHRLESHFLIDLFRRSIWIFLEQAYMVQQLNRILESKGKSTCEQNKLIYHSTPLEVNFWKVSNKSGYVQKGPKLSY